MSEMSEPDAIRTGENVRNVRCVLDTGRTDTPDTGRAPSSSSLLLATFDGKFVWVEKHGRVVRRDPTWRDFRNDASHTAAEMGPPWVPPVARRGRS
jgi:hypothetical protein